MALGLEIPAPGSLKDPSFGSQPWIIQVVAFGFYSYFLRVSFFYRDRPHTHYRVAGNFGFDHSLFSLLLGRVTGYLFESLAGHQHDRALAFQPVGVLLKGARGRASCKSK